MLNSGRASVKKPSDPLSVAYVGRLIFTKGVDRLLDALAGLKEETDFVLEITGDGTERTRLEEQTKRLGLEDRVTLRGLQTNVTPFLQKADIFVYPSKTEVFGLALVEAMAHGCICVANAVGGIPEILCDGVNGFLNTDNSTEGLRKTIIKAVQTVQNEEKREKMICEAFKNAERFSVEHTALQFDSVMRELRNDD